MKCFLTHLFLGITKPWCTILTFDMRYFTSFTKLSLEMREHLPTAPGVLSRVDPLITNLAQHCLTLVIKWVTVCPTWQDAILLSMWY
jgi:hypothetical protein